MANKIPGEQAESSQTFYGSDTTHAESDRLRRMAEQIGDRVSVGALERALGGSLGGKTIFDVGAGDSVSLGQTITGLGGSYVPSDIRSSALDAHRNMFGVAHHTSAPDLAVLAEVDPHAIHARAVFGWLGPNQRDMALAAMFEGAPNKPITIIDYDWSVADGPEVYCGAVEAAMRILRQTGFRPDYGRYMASDLESRARGVAGPDSSIGIATWTTPVGRHIPLEGALPMITSTSEALLQQMRQIGMVDQAAELEAQVSELIKFSEHYPSEPVTLPDLVSTTITPIIGDETTKTRELHRVLQSIKKPLGEHVNSLPLPGVGIAETPAQRDAARRIQAAAYYIDGIVDANSVDDNGLLTELIDPPELYNDRSFYVLATSKGIVRTVIRGIEPSPGRGPETLPEIQRLEQHAPDAYKELHKLEVLGSGKRVFEVSGLAKNPFEGETIDVINAIIGLAIETQRRGYDYAVMGLQEKNVPALRAMIGDAILPIQTADARHSVGLPGVDPNMKFVTLYADVVRVIDSIAEHAKQQRAAPFLTRIGEVAEAAATHI